jgi:ATP-dependent DNA helicase RecQ
VLLYQPADRLTHEWFVRGTFPPRSAVERVLAVLRDASDPAGAADPARLAALCRHVDARTARAVLAFHEREGVLQRPASGTGIWIRLLATPARIRRELGADAAEVAVLRALWRVGREALERGVIVDLGRLRPPLTVRGGRRLLERLRDRQFVDVSTTQPGLRVARPRALVDPAALDWPRAQRRRETELRKLDQMEAYALTGTCRRACLLGYFGEPVAERRCGRCDNCRRADDSPLNGIAPR